MLTSWLVYFLAAFLGVALAFFAAGFLAAGFLAGAAFFAGAVALAAGFLAAFFLGDLGFLAAAGFLAAFFASVFFSPSLKEPAAPVPLVWTRAFFRTRDFNAFLMKGASLATSTLYSAAMYFLMAAVEDPLRSFSPLTAASTIVEVGGWVGLALGSH